jgi:hypothetical protein
MNVSVCGGGQGGELSEACKKEGGGCIGSPQHQADLQSPCVQVVYLTTNNDRHAVELLAMYTTY